MRKRRRKRRWASKIESEEACRDALVLLGASTCERCRAVGKCYPTPEYNDHCQFPLVIRACSRCAAQIVDTNKMVVAEKTPERQRVHSWPDSGSDLFGGMGIFGGGRRD